MCKNRQFAKEHAKDNNEFFFSTHPTPRWRKDMPHAVTTPYGICAPPVSSPGVVRSNPVLDRRWKQHWRKRFATRLPTVGEAFDVGPQTCVWFVPVRLQAGTEKRRTEIFITKPQEQNQISCADVSADQPVLVVVDFRGIRLRPLLLGPLWALLYALHNITQVDPELYVKVLMELIEMASRNSEDRQAKVQYSTAQFGRAVPVPASARTGTAGCSTARSAVSEVYF